MPKPDADPHGGQEDFKKIENPNYDSLAESRSGYKDYLNYP